MSNLQLQTDKPGNVYRFIHAWELVKSHHGPEINYLLIYARVQWGQNREHSENAFSIAVQYSSTIGQNVALRQPPHILNEDVEHVLQAFSTFRTKQIGKTEA